MYLLSNEFYCVTRKLANWLFSITKFFHLHVMSPFIVRVEARSRGGGVLITNKESVKSKATSLFPILQVRAGGHWHYLTIISNWLGYVTLPGCVRTVITTCPVNQLLKIQKLELWHVVCWPLTWMWLHHNLITGLLSTNSFANNLKCHYLSWDTYWVQHMSQLNELRSEYESH